MSNLSKEEILNKITEMINELRDDINRVEDWVNTGEDEEKLETLEGILDLYNEEKEKNQEIEEQRDSLLWQRNTIDIPTIEELERKNKELAGSYQANNISKDKIREKIKYYKEKRKIDFDNHIFYDCYIAELQELLEEEN